MGADGAELKTLADKKGTKWSELLSQQLRSNTYEDMEQLEQLQQLQKKQLKSALKKKWHKRVDDLIEGQFASGNSQQIGGLSQASEPIARSRPIGRGSRIDTTKPHRVPSDFTLPEEDNTDRIMVIVKKRPAPQTPETMNTQTLNQLDDQSSLFNRELQQQPMAGGNVNEHTRRILDDKFGIMKESIFTTNNHLGLKGVPKFGSDEVF